MLKVLTQDSWPGTTLHTAAVCTDDQDGRVVKALDLRSNGQMSSWVRTPLLVEALVHSELSRVSMRFNFRTDLIQSVKVELERLVTYQTLRKEGEKPSSSLVFSEHFSSITMSGLQGLAQENIWFDKSRYDEAERRFYEGMNGIPQTPQERDASAILQDIAKARQNIQQSLAGAKTALQGSKGHTRTQKPRERKSSQNASKSEDQSELVSRLKSLELDNKNLHKVVDDLRAVLSKLESRMAVLEKSQAPASKTVTVTKAAPVQKPKVEEHNGADDDDDDIDLFGSDEEDEEAERIKAERVKEYAQRKSKKPALIAKSSILLDVKPWDDETDMSKLEECVRSVQMDGLLWGASKLVPVGYGIKKLQINCVVEDDKVGTDILEEEITKFEDYVQSVDIAAFNKI
uniref:Eukaryotic translation elongation factor 1 delta a (guanine nucleotide exchange protein) n=1 Tax=Cyprinus carpio carpio TaxID=630221 RepID=A0A9J7WYS3_CYPCA